ncbi:hypothetical protein F8M41_025868 [Gigaspora margarita]|uniref:Uncharacterized protein n=1 Tax=Gigaspora margarita TaxID=4874 RepID=A0A8H4A9U6_GIGMA|nr:hypothetical protein F8M41_025868 [Gigaspora margarita]
MTGCVIVNSLEHVNGIVFTTYQTLQIVNNAVFFDKGIYSATVVVDTLLCLVAAFGLFVICVVIYFTIIISVYAERYRTKDDDYDISEEVIETPGSNNNY